MKKWLLASMLLLQTWYAVALEISVGEGSVAAKPIAVVPFAGNEGSDDKIDFIVSSDLNQSGVFSPINPANYNERPSTPSQLSYPVFQGQGAAYVVVGQQNSDSLRFVIADALQQQVIADYTVPIGSRTLRQAAHEVSDLILQKLTGTRGAFATRLAYVHQVGDGAARRYNLMLSDIDGAEATLLYTSEAPLMSPRFSPDGKTLVYVTFEGRHAQIVSQDIATGTRTLVAREPGINASPAWSSDGSKIAMVLSKDGNPEIYYKDLAMGNLVRVTNNSSIDTEPVWSPSGNEIYFTSDRSGSPQLYSTNIYSGKTIRVTSAGDYNAGADISSDGQRIAMVRKNNNNFTVGTIDRSNGRFRTVSRGFGDETPRFSPNGKMLVFTSVGNNRNVLRIVNVDGSGENTLSAPGQIRDADWSTYIQ